MFGEALHIAPEAGALPKPPLKHANAANIFTVQVQKWKQRPGV